MPATRCRECHGKMYEEWKASTHARAAVSESYIAARAQAGTPKQCDTCHAPLRMAGNVNERAANEGVTCDVCHTIKDVSPGKPFAMHVKDAVKYGPYCDAKDHYFHRMGCAKSQTDGSLCAACHAKTIKTKAGVELPVYTTYADWKNGPANEDGMVCQQCHMPAVRAEAAVGAGERAQVRDHAFLGKKRRLRQRAVSLSVAVNKAGAKLAVDLGVINSGAGHFIPSGLPARRIVIRVRTLDAKGTPVDSYEQLHGRVLVDSAGNQAPYYAAAKLLADTRIAARKTATVKHQLRLPKGPGALHIAVWWRAFAHDVAKAMKIRPAPDQLMIEHRVVFGPPGKRGLPGKPVIVKP